MRTYIYSHKNSSANLTLSAESFEDADFLFKTLIDKNFWSEFRLQEILNEEGELIDENS